MVEQAQDSERTHMMTTWRPDLVVLDVTMPRMDGWEVVRRMSVSQELGRIPVVFLSGHRDELDVLQGLSLGAVEYVAKPFAPEYVVATVAVLLNAMDEQLREERRQALLNRGLKRLRPLGASGELDEAGQGCLGGCGTPTE